MLKGVWVRVVTLPELVEKAPHLANGSKMVKNGQKWSKWSKWSKMVKTSPKMVKNSQNGSKWFKNGQKWSKMVKMVKNGYNGSKMPFFTYFTPNLPEKVN